MRRGSSSGSTAPGRRFWKFGSIKAQGNRVVGIVRQRQEGAAYRLFVPLRVTTAKGQAWHVIECASKECVFAITTRRRPSASSWIRSTAFFAVVPRAQAAPCMQAVLTAPKKIGFGHDGLLKRLNVPASQPSLPKDAAVLAIGLDEAIRPHVLRALPELKVADKSFSFRDKTWDQPGDAILISYARRDAPGLPVTVFHGNSEAAFARALYLPYYQSHGFVVFRNGRPVERGEFEGDRATRRKPREGEPETLVKDIVWLTDAAHKGRPARGSRQLANLLRGRMFQTGAAVQKWPAVTVLTGTVSEECAIGIVDGDKHRRIEDAFMPFHESASPERPAAFDRVVRHPAKNVKGALVVLAEDAPYTLARDYAKQGRGGRGRRVHQRHPRQRSGLGARAAARSWPARWTTICPSPTCS